MSGDKSGRISRGEGRGFLSRARSPSAVPSHTRRWWVVGCRDCAMRFLGGRRGGVAWEYR